MFIVLLKFSDNKGQAAQFMEGHNEWIKRGFEASVASVAWVERERNPGFTKCVQPRLLAIQRKNVIE
jgi:hypothetical protein